jgi:hypothetical protein
MRFIVIAVLAACSVQATRFTPAGGGDDLPPPGDGSNPGTPASLSASPDGDVALGTVLIGQTSAKAAITISNDGDAASGNVTIAFDDASAGFALVDDTCSGQPLAGHTTCTFALQFTPATAAALQTTLHVTADPGGEVTKILFGTGLLQGAVDIMEAANDYGLLGLAAAAKTKTFTVRNTGQGQIGQPMPTINGDASYTVMATTCNAPLNQTDSCTVTVQFKPTTVGGKAGSLVITSSPGGSDAAQLSGTGFAHVTVTRSGDGAGSVRSSPVGIDCPTTCAADFTSSPVTLTGTGGTESTFTTFSGDCTGASCSLNLTANKSVDGKFTLNSYNVVIATAAKNPGVNKVTSSPGGINCDGATGCTAAFKFGSQVTLTASPDAVTGRFTVWTDGPCVNNTSPTCTFTVPSGGVHAAASFDWFASLTILRNGAPQTPISATTQVQTDDQQINCTNTTTLTGTCQAFFGRNAQITIFYSGNPSGQWTTCHGGSLQKFLSASFFGTACAPPTGTICSDFGTCLSSASCTMTFTQPGDYTSEYDVECDVGA